MAGPISLRVRLSVRVEEYVLLSDDARSHLTIVTGNTRFLVQ